MGRKNHKGRTSNHQARRFYRPKNDKSRRRRDDGLPPDTFLDTGQPRSAGHGLRPDRKSPRRRQAAMSGLIEAGIDVLPETHPRTCGACAEWVGRPDALAGMERGECLHPGSGFTYPPADMKACPFFH